MFYGIDKYDWTDHRGTFRSSLPDRNKTDWTSTRSRFQRLIPITNFIIVGLRNKRRRTPLSIVDPVRCLIGFSNLLFGPFTLQVSLKHFEIVWGLLDLPVWVRVPTCTRIFSTLFRDLRVLPVGPPTSTSVSTFGGPTYNYTVFLCVQGIVCDLLNK